MSPLILTGGVRHGQSGVVVDAASAAAGEQIPALGRTQPMLAVRSANEPGPDNVGNGTTTLFAPQRSIPAV
jgi:hypothetical protein